MSTGWEILHLGERLWRRTKREARELAQHLANESRQKVKVRPAAAARSTMKRNPAAEAHRPPGAKLTTYNEGRAAWRRGWTMGDNPYQSADLRQMWIKGWRAERDKPAARTMKRNPDPGAFLPFWNAQGLAKAERAQYVARTKGARLAKSLRGANRGGAVKAAEAGARKSAKFVVVAQNKRDALTLYRPSRRAADDLAAQLLAAGYAVKVSEA